MFLFGQPWLLAGLAAVGLPVLIHFLTRPRPRRIALPTWHLLVEVGAGRQSVHRLRTWLVLALRTIAVAALVLAFTRPLWTASVAERDPQAPRRVVIVVDNSLSMQLSEGGVSLFDQAKAEAAVLLSSLESGSSAAVVFAGAEPRAVLPALSRNLSALHTGLTEAQATEHKADPARAIALAGRMLESSGDVFVFSDFQESNWRGASLSAPAGVRVNLRPIVERAGENLGVTKLTLSPAEPIEGEPIEVGATVFNSTAHRRQATVRLDMEGVSREAEVELQPYSSGDVRFAFSLPSVGEVAGSVSLDVDALTADNRRHFVLNVRRALKVLLISDADEDDTNCGAYFVTKALRPAVEADDGAGIEVMRRLSQAVDRGALETADAFVLVPPVRPTGETAEIIARRVGQGAPLIVLLDGPTARDTVNALAGASRGTIRPPFELAGAVQSTDGRGVGLTAPLLYGGPLAAFDSPDAADMATMRVTRRFATEIDIDRQREIVLEYEDGVAALSVGQSGAGGVVFANLPIEPIVSTVPGSPLFPVLMHELMRALRSGEGASDNRPGRTWQVEVADRDGGAAAEAEGDEDATTYVVSGPGGFEVTASPISRGRTVRLSVPAVDQAGVFEVSRAGRRLGAAVVNIDPDESDTRLMDLDEALERAGEEGAAVSVIDEDGELASSGRPRSLWPTLAALAALALALEMLLLALWRRPVTPTTSHRTLAAGEGER